MFAEELAGNSGKKRQEDARRRRVQQQQKLKLLKKTKDDEKERLRILAEEETAAAAASSQANEQQHQQHGTAAITRNGDIIEIENIRQDDQHQPDAITIRTTPVIQAPTTKKWHYQTVLDAFGNNGNTNKNKNMTAVEQAAKARLLREQLKIFHLAATNMQRVMRAHAARRQTYTLMCARFDRGIRDLLQTTTTTETAQAQHEHIPTHIPPPALVLPVVRRMTTECLYICNHGQVKFQTCDSTRLQFAVGGGGGRKQPQNHYGHGHDHNYQLFRDNATRLSLLLQHIILPGLLLLFGNGNGNGNGNGGTNNSDMDTDMDPLSISHWMESREGRYRYQLLLATCLRYLVASRHAIIVGRVGVGVGKHVYGHGSKDNGTTINTSIYTSNSTQSALEPVLLRDQGLASLVPNLCQFFKCVLGLKSAGADAGASNHQVVWRGDKNTHNPNANANHKAMIQLARQTLLHGNGTGNANATNLSFLVHVRNFLMYNLTGGTPIPDFQEDNGRISSSSNQSTDEQTTQTLTWAGLAFDLAVEAVLSLSVKQQHGHGRETQLQFQECASAFVTHVLTIPLLEHKLPTHTLQRFLGGKSNATTSSTSPPPPVIQMLQAFYESSQHIFDNSAHHNDRIVGTIFHSSPHLFVNLRTCPCPSELSLFANLVSWLYKCPSVNPISSSSSSLFRPRCATVYFSVLGALLPLVPLGVYQAARPGSESVAVTWQRGTSNTSKSNSTSTSTTNCTPSIVSSLIVHQCQWLLQDDFVRQLMHISLLETARVVFMGGPSGNANDTADANDTAIDNALHKFLAHKSESDALEEQSLISIATQSTKSLAAQEARARDPNFMDDSKKAIGYWKQRSSKWASKMTKGFTNMFDTMDDTTTTGSIPTEPKSQSESGQGMLLNTTSASRGMATGDVRAPLIIRNHDDDKKQAAAKNLQTNGNGTTVTTKNPATNTNTAPKEPPEVYVELFLAVCRLYGTFLARWGGYAKDYNQNQNQGTNRMQMQVSTKPEACVLKLLNTICFSTKLLQVSWAVLQCPAAVSRHGYKSHLTQLLLTSTSSSSSYLSTGSTGTPVKALGIHTSIGGVGTSRAAADLKLKEADTALLLFLSAACLSHTLVVTDDSELHDLDRPIPKHHVRRFIASAKQLTYRALWLDDKYNHNQSSSSSSSKKSASATAAVTPGSCNYFGLALKTCSVRTLKDLHNRSSRRLVCAPSLWVVDDAGSVLQSQMSNCKSHEDYIRLLRTSPLLQQCPFVIPFKRRLKLFERIVTSNRIAVQGSNDHMLGQHNLKPGVSVRIMRGRVLEDGLTHLNKLGRDLRQRIVVQYTNQAGRSETGMDVGGLFKEFWSDLSDLAFNPHYALFQEAQDNSRSLYPNPSSGKAHGNDTHRVLFQFLGRILGKAIYEGITIQPQFSHFFLAFLRGDYNFMHLLSDLVTMDPQLYQNLMFLKTYKDGDVSDLALTFQVTTDDFGTNTELPLVPNGANIPVTNANKQRYIQLVAKYHLYDSLKVQSEAFCQGLWDVLDKQWLQMFDPNELQVLISGSSDGGKLDLVDMKSHTRYAGGYTSLDVSVRRFWNVLSKLSSHHQKMLLKFVTSSERPPPLGFGSMNPPFTLQRIGISRDADKLPSAATCFNTLKLPTYSSEKVLKERLIYSIESGAGFELT
jgi:ubiquitin-protein ligase E3 C